MSSKREDTELNRREANVQEKTRAQNRGFISVFIEVNVKKTRFYICEHGENNQTVIINLCKKQRVWKQVVFLIKLQ